MIISSIYDIPVPRIRSFLVLRNKISEIYHQILALFGSLVRRSSCQSVQSHACRWIIFYFCIMSVSILTAFLIIFVHSFKRTEGIISYSSMLL